MTLLAILRAIWGFLRSPPGQVLAAVVAMLTALWFADTRAGARGRAEGVSAERARWEARLATDAARARAVAAQQAVASQRVGDEVEAAKTVIGWRTRTLIERISADVPPDPAGWSLPVGFVRHHIEATSGLPPIADAADRPVDASSGVGLADLAEIDDRNYGACHANIEALKGWQAWWAAVNGLTSEQRR